MRVNEFLDMYPVESTVPPIKDGVYGAARRQGHIIGEATLNVIQGLPVTATQRKAMDVASVIDTVTELSDYDTADPQIANQEFMHFTTSGLHAMLRYQFLGAEMGRFTDREFNYMNQASVHSLALAGLSLMGQAEQERQEGSRIRQIIDGNESYHLLTGFGTEIDTGIALLGLAKSVRPERNLLLLPAPAQVEWYQPSVRGNKNKHADFLLLDVTNPNDRKIAGVQVKSVASEESGDSYDTDSVTLICGQSDLGNWIQEDGRTYSWPGRFSLQRAGELLLNDKKLVQAIGQGQISRDVALALSRRYRRVLQDIKKNNINYKDVYAKIWPRLEKALDN